MTGTLERLAELAKAGAEVSLEEEVIGRDLFRDLSELLFRCPKIELTRCECRRREAILELEGDLASPYPDVDGNAGLRSARVHLCFFLRNDKLECVARVSAAGGADEHASGAYLGHLAAGAGGLFDGSFAEADLVYSSVDWAAEAGAVDPPEPSGWPATRALRGLRRGVGLAFQDLRPHPGWQTAFKNVTGMQLAASLPRVEATVRRSRRSARRITGGGRRIDPWQLVAPEEEDDDEDGGEDREERARDRALAQRPDRTGPVGPDAAWPRETELRLVVPDAGGLPDLDLGPVRFKVEGVDVRVPIEGDAGSLEAVLRFTAGGNDGAMPQLRFEAAVDLENRIATISSAGRATLSEFLAASSKLFRRGAPVAGGDGDSPLPDELLEPFSVIALDDAWIEVQLPRPQGREALGEEEDDEGDSPEHPAVRALGFTSTASGISLIEGFCTFDASVTACVLSPFDPDARRVAARLDGDLVIGDLRLGGTLGLPEGRFQAEARFDLGDNVLEALGIPPPTFARFPAARLMLAVAGDWRTKAFAAAIAYDEDGAWTGSSLGLDLRFERLGLAFRRDPDGRELAFTARMKVKELGFAIHGEIADAVSVRGEMAGELRLDEAVRGLFGGKAPLPENSGTAALSDVRISATFGGDAPAFALSGRATLSPFEGFGLEIESFSFENSGSGISTRLVATLALERLALRLSAEKRAGESGGWQFHGAVPSDGGLNLGDVADDLAEFFALGKDAAVTPPALRDVDVRALGASYDTEQARFELIATVQIRVADSPVEATVTITVANDRMSFAARITVGEVVFAGRYVTAQTRSGLLVHYEGGEVSLNALVHSVFPGAPQLPGTDVALRRAFFLHAEESGRQSRLFGLELSASATVSLDDLPALCALVGRGRRIGIEELRLVAASDEISTEAANALEVPDWARAAAPVPAGTARDRPAPVAIKEGLTLSGTLALGVGDGQPFALDAGDVDEPSGGPPPAEEERTDGGQEPAATTIEIGRAIGPLRVERVRLGYHDTRLHMGLDAAVDLAGLRVGLTGLGVAVPLAGGGEVDLRLDGLELSYSGGPVSVTGAFLHKPPDTYQGLALVSGPNFSITGFGAFTTVGRDPSIFVFAALHAELGGPPFFRVRGLAAGFGYNRKLTLPPVEEVARFPLVRAALDADIIDTGDPAGTVSNQLAQLEQYVAPSAGNYWLAGGVRFSSFEIIHSVALVSVSFGHDVEIGLLGLSRLNLPKDVSKPRLAQIELAIRVSFRPDAGTLAVEGRLTDASFLFSPACRLKGGFAFYAWIGNEHDGDFVVTLGGYHPEFPRPAHYPSVPALGIDWRVSDTLRVSATLYFAMTPSCIMAGGTLTAVYQSDRIRASFTAYAHFLVRWEPVAYSGQMGVRVRVAADLELVVIKLELAVRLDIWGPPFAGEIYIDLDVIAFSIRFGPDRAPVAPLLASEFRSAFLPQEHRAVIALKVQRGLTGTGKVKDEDSAVVSAHAALEVQRGLTGSGKVKDEDIPVVNAHGLILGITSLVPITRLAVNGLTPGKITPCTEGIGIRPMARASHDGPLSLTVMRLEPGGAQNPACLDALEIRAIDGKLPGALWEAVSDEHEKAGRLPAARAESRTVDATIGVVMRFAAAAPEHSLPPVDKRDLQYFPIERTLPPLEPVPALERCEVAVDEIVSQPATIRRDAVLEVLIRWSGELHPEACPPARASLERMGQRLADGSGRPGSYFQAPLSSCSLGTSTEADA